MSVIFLCSLGCCTAAIYILLLSLYRLFLSPLRSIPGPFLARLTDAWYFWHVWQGHFEHVNLELHKTYGPVVRYGPNRYSLSGEDAAKIVYGLGSKFPKSSWYSSWTSPGTWGIFADQDREHHAKNRRLYQNAYSMSSLITYEAYVDECSDIFHQRLMELANANTPINMGYWLQCYAFDVIGLITYSKRLGFLDHGHDIGGVMNALEDHMTYATLCGIYPRLHPYLFRLRNFLAGNRGVGREYVLNFTKERIAEHQSLPKGFSENTEKDTTGTTDFLTKFFAKHQQEPDIFTATHIMVGCSANMVAGSDTTAITLSAILYYLLKNRACFQRLRDEIDEYAKKGQTSAHISFKGSQEMPYLQAVIKEALRMHPATALPLERLTPEGGATISGQFFPSGSIVGINCWTQHRNPQIFGLDCNDFRPERWLVDDTEGLARMNRCWMPFGLGSRTCIGRHISHLEISKLIPRLVRDFDFELGESLGSSRQSWSTINHWFVKSNNLLVKISIRGRKGA